MYTGVLLKKEKEKKGLRNIHHSFFVSRKKERGKKNKILMFNITKTIPMISINLKIQLSMKIYH